MRFLDCTNGNKDPSKSVLDVGVDNALMFSGFENLSAMSREGWELKKSLAYIFVLK
jgi:radical S-adenosyl methionine domain-containing protein 2